MKRTQAFWLLATMLLSFALAGCASKGPSSPRGSSSGSEASPQSTPPGSASESSSATSATSSATSSSESSSMESQRSGSMSTPTGDRVEIRRSWVQVRSQPNETAKAIALAFGNDTLPVVETQGDWVRVKIDKNRDGWIPRSATESR